MKRILRPAFIVTAAIAAGCTGMRTQNPPPADVKTPEEQAAFREKYGIHPRDADLHTIYRKSDGSCYVQVENDEPPPKDLMSGERWVKDKELPCPPEFDDPAFAAIGDQEYWILDRTTNECSVAQAYGNPPLPPVRRACPPNVKKLLPPGASEPPVPEPPAPEPPKP
jgi:hypothetical protein